MRSKANRTAYCISTQVPMDSFGVIQHSLGVKLLDTKNQLSGAWVDDYITIRENDEITLILESFKKHIWDKINDET